MALSLTALGRNLKKYRALKKLTQQELAEKLLVSAQSVSKWECAQAIPDLDKLCAVADILEVSLDALLDSDVSNKKVFVGIDGGGTKTEFVLFDEKGKILNHLMQEGANPNTCGLESCLQVIKTGLKRLLDKEMRLCGIFVGCAGFLSGNYAQLVKEELQQTYPRSKVDCYSDIMNVIASGSNSRQCIAVICGTGSVVYANENRNLYRLGGGGYLLDKQGSGFDIGRDVLRVALQERDGSGEKSLITALVEKQLGGSVWNNIQKIYKRGTAYIASFAPLAIEAYEMGDAIAGKLLEENAAYLGNLIQRAYEMHACGKTVVLSGGIFTEKSVYLEMIKKSIRADLEFEIPPYPPVYGACVMACELYGIDTGNLSENFLEQYQAFLNG